ncbi:MAG: ComEC/Rec2 family competence protein [Pirellulaceae bacterium]
MEASYTHRLLREPPEHFFYRYPLVWLLLAMVCGIQLAPLMDARWLPVGLVTIPLLIATISVLQWKTYYIAANLLSFVTAVLLATTYATAFRPPDADGLSSSAKREGQPIAIRGVIHSVAEWRPNPNHRTHDPASEAWQTQWQLRCESVRHADEWIPITAISTLLVDGRITEFLPGDEVQVFGDYRAISPPTNPGAFDFAKHAHHESQFVRLSTGNQQQISRLSVRSNYPLLRLRGRVVRAVDRWLRQWVSFDQAPLAAALVFGQRAQVDWEDQQELMATGTLHLLAISGMHVGIIAAAIIFVCSFFSLRNRTEFMAIAIVCGLYAALAGGQPPVLRAVVLVALFALARTLGRKTRLANLLSLAAIILLLVQSANLGNVGVHLSFLAVGSIGVFAMNMDFKSQRRSALQAVIEEGYSHWRRRWLQFLRGTLASLRLSFWVWLMTCPLIWMHFHVIAPIAIPLNVIIAGPLVVALLCGLTTGLFGWLPPVAWGTGQVTGGSLALIAWIVKVGQAIPLGHVWLPAPPIWWTVCFYGLTVFWLLAFGKRRRSMLAAVLLIWIMVGMSFYSFGPRGCLTTQPPSVQAAQRPSAAELRCTFLDVGHGTSAIVEFPTGEVWLYDAGHLGAAVRSHQEIAAALWELPTARLDTLVISHADADHYNATRGLLERFRIGRIASTQRFWNSTAREVVAVHSAIEQRGVPRQIWDTSSQGVLGPVSWQVLHPTDSLRSESDNASSLCLLLEYAGTRILLPGDLEGGGLLDLVELPERPCHALMAPHHGSLSHDPGELLAWCRPQVVVISGNHRAVRPRVLEQYSSPSLSQLGVTFRDGAIQLRIASDGQLSAYHWQQDHWALLPELE